MTDYICERGCKFTKQYMDATVIQIFGPDERAYCAFCEFKKPATASFSKGFEQMPVLTEFCLGMSVDVYEETKRRIEEIKTKLGSEQGSVDLYEENRRRIEELMKILGAEA